MEEQSAQQVVNSPPEPLTPDALLGAEEMLMGLGGPPSRNVRVTGIFLTELAADRPSICLIRVLCHIKHSITTRSNV